MLALILIVLCSTITTTDMLPEIEITAPRYSSQETDSVGMISEVIVYGDRYSPQSANSLVRTYDKYRYTYQQLFDNIYNYGILIITALFMVAFVVIVLVKEDHHRHAYVPRHEQESPLHRWVRKHYDLKNGNWKK